jgi:hypothetical protein
MGEGGSGGVERDDAGDVRPFFPLDLLQIVARL